MHKVNPKKWRKRLKAGDCNLSEVPVENLSGRQTRKMHTLAEAVLQAIEAKIEPRTYINKIRREQQEAAAQVVRDRNALQTEEDQEI